ncbi:PTS sugar transporter subunit IIA [Liquorilactobacillus mali]|uniref:PTS EIIA type-2 domain-containing protein n=1 Tax=Liquorilactobacillus mali TaxID=1618 RepID=A0A0R2FMV3_9LACO|nr:PTS sugar transporter subunit IIA [Liquorilactobacillus mali]KRN29824.1 hypothetical protein IV36_GL000370 [Liquorilactobacillus mali]MDN7145559.1 PTS sugar transporter subunit IIA [Liquorilactobacillus mali]
MDIVNILKKDIMIMDLKAKTKEDALHEMVNSFFVKGIISDRKLFEQDIFKREEEATTGIGEGIAMAHARNGAVKEAAVAGTIYGIWRPKKIALFKE